MTIGETYQLNDVTTPKGQCLNKGGTVKLVHIFKFGTVPEQDAITKYYGHEPGSKAYEAVHLPFKEDRLVLERKNGKYTIILERYSSFLTGADASTAVSGKVYDNAEDVKRDVAINQVWHISGEVVQRVWFKVIKVDRDTNRVLLSYRNITPEKVEQWLDGHLMPLSGFAASIAKNNATLVSA